MAKRTTQKLPTPRKLPSGKWFVRVSTGGVEHPITRDTKEECLQEAAAIKYGFRSTQRTPRRERTLRQLCEEWIADAEAHKGQKHLSPSTISGYDVIIRCRAQDIVDKPVSTITQEVWQGSIDAAAQEYAPKTVANTYRFLAEVLKDKTGTDYTSEIAPGKSKRRDFLDYEQIQVLIEYVRGHELEIAVLLALSSLRRSEILALTWDKVDLEKGRIRVEGAAVQDKTGKLVYKKENKTEKSNREIPIIDPLRRALEDVPEQDRHGIVCKTATTHISARFRTILRGAGLPEMGCHSLRHSFASLCYHLNVPEEIAMEMGGWSDYKTMRTIYTHIAHQDKDHFESAFTKFFGA